MRDSSAELVPRHPFQKAPPLRLRRPLLLILAVAAFLAAGIQLRPAGLLAPMVAEAGPGFTPTVFRPTPIPTATRTPIGSPTPEPSDVFLCSGGENDGFQCSFDVDCPDGACVLALGVCSMTSDIIFCGSDDDCTNGGTCTLTQKVCGIGDNKGLQCLDDSQCPGFARCVSTGLFCVSSSADGGSFDLYPCVDTEDCIDFESDPNNTAGSACVSPDVFLCSGGPQDGSACIERGDCEGGSCVLANKVCNGGGEGVDGFDCDNNADCNGGTCEPTQKVCLAGDSKGFGCLNDGQCPNGTCGSTGLFCDGGVFDMRAQDPSAVEFPVPCVDDADCIPAEGDPGACVAAVVQNLVCSGGNNNGGTCSTDDDCPAGICVLSQPICVGGDSDLFFCESQVDCPNGSCQASFTVCDGGDLQGFSCLSDSQCGSQAGGGACISDGGTRPCCFASGRVCDGGPFDGLGCVEDVNCNCDSTDQSCLDVSEFPGACIGRTPRLCSLEAPCVFEGSFQEQVFAPADPQSPASADYYLAPSQGDAVGVVVVLRSTDGDADLYAGSTLSNNLDDYPFRSENGEGQRDVVRIDAHTDPTFATVVSSAGADLAIAVIAFDGSPHYTLQAVYLQTSPAGDADCDNQVTENDTAAVANVLFDPAAEVSRDAPGSRCIGADGNDDGIESAADIVSVVRRLGT